VTERPDGSALPDPDVMMAKFLALGVRNGVEDLHAEGAFGDDLAPTFNRLVRRHIYEALYALTHVDADSEKLRDYIVELAGDDLDDPLRALLPGAVTNAIYEFAEGADIEDDTAEALIDAGIAGLHEHIDLYERLADASGADERSQRMATFAFAMIPAYWEDPECTSAYPARQFR
jgi:hypothetical protein